MKLCKWCGQKNDDAATNCSGCGTDLNPLRYEPLPSPYGSFWQRFWALIIDGLVLSPLIFLNGWLVSYSKTWATFLVLPINAISIGYFVYFHGRFGRTLGKRAMGIRVVRTTWEPIGWRQAWLRSSVDIFFAAISTTASYVALSRISEADFHGLGFVDRTRVLHELEPVWLSWTNTAEQIWMWSEVVVMLFNHKRRALHDFIAGTVVISEG